MSDPSDAVDTYLAERFKIGLEQVLLDASAGRLAPGLSGIVDVACNQINHWRYADRGVAFQYEGTMSVEGVAYRFRLWIYEEEDGRRFMTDLSEFAAVDWQARLRMG
ncbi:MAG TPA: hypothetical protein VKQ29_16745 [Aliidongia sp.]|nr:hypothetical protein [Aliidongia sp.]